MRLFLSIFCAVTISSICSAQGIDELEQIYRPTPIDTARFEARYLYSRYDKKSGKREVDYPFVLQVGNKSLLWEDLWTFTGDSVFFAHPQPTMRTRDIMAIYKDLPAFRMNISMLFDNPDSLYCIDSFIGCMGDAVHVDKNPDIDWKISGETAMIRGFECQKAECDLSGHHWTVWFCEEIPSAYGPWKLQGLPGVVVKAETENDGHVFDLLKISSPGKLMLSTHPMNVRRNKLFSSQDMKKLRNLHKKSIKSAADFFGSDTSWMSPEMAVKQGFGNLIEN